MHDQFWVKLGHPEKKWWVIIDAACFPGSWRTMDQTHVSLVNIKIAYIAFAIHSPQNISPGVVSKFGNQTLEVGLSSFHPIHNCHVRAPPPTLSHESRVSDSDPSQKCERTARNFSCPFSQAPASRLWLTHFLQALATWSGWSDQMRRAQTIPILSHVYKRL